MRRIGLIALITVILGTGTFAVEPERSAHPYRKSWKRSILSKPAMAGIAVGSAIGQARNHPKNYGQGVAGFGKRVGAGFATHVVSTSVTHVVAARLHEDLHYHRSDKQGFGPRLGYALKSTVITRNTRTGKHRPAVGVISGHAAAGAFSQAAMHAGSGAATAGYGLAAEAGMNVAREFWPRRGSGKGR